MTLRGSVADFPLEIVLKMLASSGKTGELQIRSGDRVAVLGFASGQLVSALSGDDTGDAALGEIFSISDAEFEFVGYPEAPEANLSGDLDQLIATAAEERDRIAAIREVIPSDKLRFRLSEKATEQGAVKFVPDQFVPDQWRALLAVNGERDVNAVAQQLRIGRVAALDLLAALIRAGVVEAVAAPAWSPPEPAWTPPVKALPAAPPAPPAVTEWAPPPPAAPDPRADALHAALDARLGALSTPSPAPPPAAPPPPPVEPVTAPDDRFSALAGIFTPPPQAPAAQPPAAPTDPWAAPPPAPVDAWAPSTPATDAWAPATPAAPTDAWGPPAPAEPEPIDPRLAALAAPAAPGGVEPAWSLPQAPAPLAQPQSNVWAPPAAAPPKGPTPAEEWAPPPPAAEPKKKRGLFGRRKREEAPEPATRTALVDRSASTSRGGLLGAFSNALLTEYNSGHYGKGRIEERMASLLMRVDEQADPIDRSLPVLDERIEIATLEREALPETQLLPYLALLVSQIYEDAAKTFGKDKAKRGFRAARQDVFGGDVSALGAPELAGKLPKV